MNWIHTLTNHFTDELGVTGRKDKQSKADRGGRLQKSFSVFTRKTWTEEGDFAIYSPFLLAYSFKVNKLCHSHRLL